MQDGKEFIVHADASQKGRDTLTERRGYSYVVSRRRKSTVYWRCSVRNRKNICPATVTQYGESDFQRGRHKHSHGAVVGVEISKPLIRAVKVAARQDVFQPASEIVDKQLKDAALSRPCPALPAVANIVRGANRHRCGDRPKDPQDLAFTVDTSYVPGDFLQSDVQKHGQRHIILASPQCLRLLAVAKSSYMDGTFAVVHAPFAQLFSIHCFVKGDMCLKQVPLAFVLMSRRKTKDYVAVLSALRAILPRINVRSVTSDFERGLWRAVATVFPEVIQHGCTFHWTQAVYRKIQSLGLAPDYVNNRDVHKICRQLMALPLLPASEIPRQFARLRQQPVNEAVRALFDYVEATWIKSSVWPPSSWSAFRRPIRTNNDVEGWHYRLNRRARSTHLPFYVLIRLLWDEMQICKMQLKLVSDRKLTRSQSTRHKNVHSRLTVLWTEFESGARSAKNLLKACAHIYGPNE